MRVKASQDNVAGVRLPKFESVKEAQDSKLGLIGLGSGGKQIQECRWGPRAVEGVAVGWAMVGLCTASQPASQPALLPTLRQNRLLGTYILSPTTCAHTSSPHA